MRSTLAIILGLTLTIVGTTATAPAATDDSASLRQAPPGSIARQLLLKFRLKKEFEGSLALSLNHNRQEWESLSPDQRQQYRNEALAFQQKSPEEQDALLKKYEKLIKMTADQQEAYRRRAEWLKVVVASLSAEDREQLQKLSPDERAKKLLERKAELIHRGQLPADAPTTTTAPSE